MTLFEQLDYHEQLASEHMKAAELAYQCGEISNATIHATMATMHYSAYTALMQK